MARLTVRRIELPDESAFLAAHGENWESNFVFAHYFDSLARGKFNRFPALLDEIEQGINLPPNHVPSTLLFAFEQSGKIVGRVSIRHVLSPELLRIGGHVGYGVVPSERRKGYATEILRLTLEYLRLEHGSLSKILVTCDDDNTGSIRTIESNGGVLENILVAPDLRVGKRRYWISLRSTTN